MKVLLQTSLKGHPELKDVPIAINHAKTKDARQLLEILDHAFGTSFRSYSTPPGTPKDRLAILQKAFMATMRDPEFLADAKKARLEIAPIDGPSTGKTLAGFYDSDKSMVAKLKKILARRRERKGYAAMTIETQLTRFQNQRQRNSARPAVFAARAQVRSRSPARARRGDEFLSAAARHFRPGLAEQGYHCFVINTRGHDWINRAGGDLTDFCGATYEKFEDSAKDFDGALECLSQQGYKRFILVGHSLGCIKSLLYQGTRRAPT